MTDAQALIRELVVVALGILVYCSLGYVFLFEIERRLFGSGPPRFYRGIIASLLQVFWPISLPIVTLVGLATRRRQRQEPQRIRSVSP